jgi:hypothetical protein
MKPGQFCRELADNSATVQIRLRPTSFSLPLLDILGHQEGDKRNIPPDNEIMAEMVTHAAGPRREGIKQSMRSEGRPHAVCTVQTFRNAQSGPMLYLFTAYYISMGWTVLIYDRFGFHREFLAEFIGTPGVYYHPYTCKHW